MASSSGQSRPSASSQGQRRGQPGGQGHGQGRGVSASSALGYQNVPQGRGQKQGQWRGHSRGRGRNQGRGQRQGQGQGQWQGQQQGQGQAQSQGQAQTQQHGQSQGQGNNQGQAQTQRQVQSQGQGQGQNQGQGQGPSSLQQDMAFWRARVQDWYPKLQERAYFLPPVFMNTTGEQAVSIYGTQVFLKRLPADNVPAGVPDVLYNSTVKENRCQQNVLRALHEVSEKGKEVMFVLSELLFKDYLPPSTLASPGLPTPRDLKAKKQDQGDFDVLVLHKHLGILVGEIKSVGDNFGSLGLSEQDQETQIVKKVQQAVKQLEKAHSVLRHLTTDQQSAPRVTMTLVLPGISSAKMTEVLANNPLLTDEKLIRTFKCDKPTLKDAMCRCLDLSNSDDPVPFCMTSDDVINPHDWWQKRMAANGPDPAMNDAVYLDLVSRFCGPATTVSVFCSSEPRLGHQPDVRTEGEGVSETAHRFTRFMVTPDQLTVLHVSPPFVFLVGPPGTGKTFVLILKALDWLGRGEHVVVFSGGQRSEAASRMIYHQLQETVTEPSARARLHMQQLDEEAFKEDEQQALQTALTTLLATVPPQGGLNLIVDEAPWEDIDPFTNFAKRLHDQVPQLQMWAASPFHQQRPPYMTEVQLTEPLRTPPEITRLVQRTMELNAFTMYLMYSEGPSPLPTEGPWMREVLHDGQGHEQRVVDCETCGDRVGRILKEELHVGCAPTDTSRRNPQALTFRDVFLLSSYTFFDESNGRLKGFLRGMQAILGPHFGFIDPGVPGVCSPAGSGAILTLENVATFQGPDVIAVGTSSQVAGLERKVVVFLGDMNDSPAYFQKGVSRSTAQLVRVKSAAESGLQAVWTTGKVRGAQAPSPIGLAAGGSLKEQLSKALLARKASP